jgi:hypothetical protein
LTAVLCSPRRHRAAWGRLAAATFLCGVAGSAGAPAEETQGPSFGNGLSSESPLLKPGKLDYLYRAGEDFQSHNAFLWSPIFKGGAGNIALEEGAPDTNYAGAYARPLQFAPALGELIIGALGTETDGREDYEVQAEYRFPFGLGLGGGTVRREDSPLDVRFAKATWRQPWKSWSFLFELQAQEVDDEVSPGGYAAVNNDVAMAVYGNDGEQWRACLGLIAPDSCLALRPAGEVLYVDNDIGDVDGPKVWFVNATLGFEGGFLSHPARLGRAMGPQGLEFGNPLGFLQPTWNRRHDPWELGRLADFRLERIELPNRRVVERYEGLVFPFALDRATNLLDDLFVGGSFIRRPDERTPGVLAGFSGKVLFLDASLEVEYEIETRQSSLVLGIIDWF